MPRPPKSRSPRRCQSHCSGCGSHFFSDSAFDAHRIGGSCWGEASEGRCRILREDAVCTIGGEVPQIAVCLYGIDPGFRSNSPSLAPSEAPGGPDLGDAA